MLMNTSLAEFLFTGVAVLPGTLAFGGHLDVAMLAFCPLLIAACLRAAYEDSGEPEQKSDSQQDEAPKRRR
jgi:hypothetical protein